jgi:hypothetical protein
MPRKAMVMPIPMKASADIVGVSDWDGFSEAFMVIG